MSRESYIMGETLIVPMWLIFTSGGEVRVTRREPTKLARDERAMHLCAKLPLALWAQPTLSATLTVEAPDPDARVMLDITAANTALNGVLGVDIDLQVREPEE